MRLAGLGDDEPVTRVQPLNSPLSRGRKMSTRYEIDIDGMTCGKCVARVENALAAFDEVDEFEVVLDPGHASILAPPGLDPKRFAEAIEDVGFDAVVAEGLADASVPLPEIKPDEAPSAPAIQDREYDAVVAVEGMTCASCVARVETALANTPGVSRVVVNYATEKAHISFDPGADLSDQDVAAVIEGAGYDVGRIERAGEKSQTRRTEPEDPTDSVTARRRREAEQWKGRWVWGLVITIPLLFLQMGPMWFGFELAGAADLLRLSVVAYLTAVVLGHTGRPFYTSALKGLKHLSVNMDTLVAMGSAAAMVFSTAQLIRAFMGSTIHEVYFDGAAMIVTLIAVGKWLEARAKGQAGAELESLLDLAPRNAMVKRGGDWVEIDVRDLSAGDVVMVRPGEKIPADGEVVEGTSDVDTSMVTGESVPVTKSTGDEVIGGTINRDGSIQVRVERTGSESTLQQIIDQVEAAQASKADIQRLADRVSSIFVPVILVISVITFAVWMFITGDVGAATLPAVAVLIVACPCALGLATPTAMMVGSAWAARHGILIREAQALERAKSLDAIIFDKTGTLTTGNMSVDEFVTYDDEADVALGIASLERPSEHPLAAAMVTHMGELGAKPKEVDDFENTPGHGVSGRFDGATWRVGKPGWIALEGQTAEDADRLMRTGATVVAAERDGAVVGLVALRDAPKAGAKDILAELGRRGVDAWLITGDNEATAHFVADELGIARDRVRAGVLPGDKASVVEELRDAGKTVAMVGDGVNDAPALAAADLGIALGSGTDVAMQTADITLVSNELEAVLRAIDVSNATFRKIRQNLFWAFFYNTALVPVAALGLLQPAFAAGAMALSSVSVVSNSLLLRRFRA